MPQVTSIVYEEYRPIGSRKNIVSGFSEIGFKPLTIELSSIRIVVQKLFNKTKPFPFVIEKEKFRSVDSAYRSLTSNTNNTFTLSCVVYNKINISIPFID